MTFSIKGGEGGTVPHKKAIGAQLLSKHCVTMSQVRFTIIFVFVSLIELSLDCREGLKSEITEIVDEKYVFKISKIQNFRNTRNQ